MVLTLGLAGLAAIAALVRSSHSAHAPALAFEASQQRAQPRRELAERTARSARLVVYVAGEVARPGVYTLPLGSRAEAAVRAAGGLRSNADPLAVNLAALLEDGQEIAVPQRGATFDAVREGERPSRKRHKQHVRGASGRRHARKAPDQAVDINSADAATLQTLPGIGPALAERIVEFRETNGPFASLDDLLDVAGLSAKLLDELQPYALVGSR